MHKKQLKSRTYKKVSKNGKKKQVPHHPTHLGYYKYLLAVDEQNNKKCNN